MFGPFDSINVDGRELWKSRIMSFVYALIYLLTLGGACFGSWKAALYWNNRKRDARPEDMRDQEIRELGAALNVARKKLEKLDNRSDSSAQELALLQEQVSKTAAELAESQQKIIVAEAAVNREIETRETLDARLAQMHRELDAAKSRAAELEVQVKIVQPSSGLVAGLDDLFEDDEKEVYTIRHEHKVLKLQVAEMEQAVSVEKAESARWKQHCQVMSKTAKALRQRTDELGQQLSGLDDLKAKAEQLIKATADNETLRKEVGELRETAAENPQLKARLAELTGVQDENRDLQLQVTKLADVYETNTRLMQQLNDFSAIQLQLLETQKENQQLQAQLTEIATLQQENGDLRARIDALVVIEGENGTLRSDLRTLQGKHTDELNSARLENEKLQVRVAALDRIQEENEQLLQQIRELRHAQAKVNELQTQLAELEPLKATCIDLEAKLAEFLLFQEQLAATQTENSRLQTQLAALDRAATDNAELHKQLLSLQQSEKEHYSVREELGKRIESLMQELRNTDKLKNQLAEWQVERAQTTAQLLALEESAAQLQVAQSEAARLQSAETAHVRLGMESLQKQEYELRQTIKLLETDKEYTSKQLNEAHELLTRATAQTTELRVAHDAQCAKIIELENSQLEYNSLLQLASDELTAEKAVNNQLREELAARKHEPISEGKPQNEHATQLPPATTTASDCADDENADTDSLPALRVAELQDDLKSIRGVGAKLEQKLNMIGICNFRDLVELEERGYERATKLIPDLANRIQRDNWMQQARDLHRHKYNEAI